MMMHLHRFIPALFMALALLGSQWVLATHSHHEDWLHPDPDCQLCKHAIQFNAFTADPPVLQPVFVLLERRHETPSCQRHANKTRFYNTRAPPDLI
jgi:hypothetical protein